ncbi:MAG: RDD family protein [Candidatus Limnocylindrales bacterium]
MSGPGPESSPTPEQPAPPAPPAPAAPPAVLDQAASRWAEATAPKPVPGRAGLFYADVPNRSIAYIIDAILLAILSFIVAAVFSTIGLSVYHTTLQDLANGSLGSVNYFAAIIIALVNTAIGGAYFVYTWMNMRGSPGQRLLGMQVGNAADGASLTMEQAIKRWIALGAPIGIISAFNPAPTIGVLLGLVGFIWFIALLVTTAQSPTKQGLHDQFASTVVVKAARAIG